MGSAFAGVKAGLLGGMFYAGSIGVFNFLLLNVFKDTVLGILANLGCSGTVSGGPAPTPEDCFSSITAVYLPIVILVIFVISLIFAGSFGGYFEYIPGKSYRVRAALVSLILLTLLLFLNLTGVPFDQTSNVMVLGFDAVATILYSFILAFLYKRYTRIVEFTSEDPDSLRIIVDRKDVTGKVRTLAHMSSHKIRALASAYGLFKEWSFSGGVSVEEPQSFETQMRVEGDGLLKASASSHKSR